MTAKTTLADLVSESSLETLAGERYFERGVAYFRESAVELLHCDDREIAGSVLGTEPYGVRLWMKRGLLNWACTCPLGDRGEFCKHLVAAGLAWLARGSAGPDTQGGSECTTIRAFLKSSDRQTLEAIILRHAARNDKLAAGLLVAAQEQGLNDPAAVKERIRKAFDIRGFVDYREMPSFVARAATVVELLEGALSGGDMASAFELSTYAAQRGLKAMENCDDSDGGMGGIVGKIAAVHLQAARQRGLASSELAKNLFDLQLADGFGFFSLEEYRPALGKEGLTAYRKLAQTAWKKVPPRPPGSRDGDSDNGRYQLTGIMKTLARMDNDTDALVDVLRRDLTQPYTWLQIAETLSKGERHDEALQWAEEGRKAFRNPLIGPIDDFLAAEYHRRKRHDDAVALRWLRFDSHPDLDGYQKLKAAADHAKNWKPWREKALALLRQANSPKPRTSDVFSHVDSKTSVLIQIFLWEDDPRAALAEARANGCPDHLWLQIARALETGSPADSIAIYQRQIEPIVRMTNNQAYDHAADLVRRIRDLMARTGKSGEFAPYLDTLRTQYKAKRNFMERLNRIAVGGEAG